MSARIWLPSGALAGPPLQAAIEHALRDWSADWFATGIGLRVNRLEGPAPCRPEKVGSTSRVEGAIAIAASASSIASLRSKALDMRRDPGVGSEREKALLRGFDKRLLEGLQRHLEAALRIEPGTGRPSPSPQQPMAVETAAISALIIDRSGAEVLRLTIPAEHAAIFRKSSLPRPRRRESPRSLDHAIGRSRLKLEGMLGSTKLSFAELAGLGPGDVLVLDRRLDDSIELVAAGVMPRLGCARLDSAERMTVVVQ